MNTSHDLLRQFASCSKDLTFVYDFSSTTFPYLSPSASNFLDISAEEIHHEPQVLLSLLQAEDRDYVMKEIQSLREGNLCIDIECRLFMPNQKIKWLQLKVYLLEEEPVGSHIAGIATDITHKKEYELSLLAIKEQKDTALQILGHDLRSPLNTITLTAQLMEKEMHGEKSEQLKKYFNIISTTCRNSLNLIGEVLNVEYLEAQQMGLKYQRMDLINRIQTQLDVPQ